MKTILWFFIFLFAAATLFGRNSYKIEGNSVIVDLEGIGVKSRVLKVEVWSDKTVKIISGMDIDLSTFQSLIPSIQPLPIKFKVNLVQNNIEISTKKMIVSIHEDGLVSIFNRDGKKMILESDRFFEPTNSIDGKFKIKQRFFLNIHEDIYGFGYSDSIKRFNIRYNSFIQSQSLSKIASPVFYSEKNYAMIWDNYSSTFFNDKKGGLEISSDYADEIQYFLIYGSSWDEIIEEIRSLTGSVPMLPRWAFGHWCSPENYLTSDDLNAAIKKYSDNVIPVETTTTSDYSLFEEEKNIIASSDFVGSRLSCVPAYSELKEKYVELQKYTLDRRPCIPTFSNYPGVQKFGTFLIAGEVKPNWQTLKGQVSAGVNLSLSGQSYWSTNIGGNMPPDPGLGSYPELLTRWYQFAAFSPVFRAPKPDRDLLYLKERSNTDYETAQNAVELRYRLMPYIYSAASDVAFNNGTFTRSLMFDYQKNEKVHSIDQQYLFGKSLMICPVTEPLAKQLSVYLPEGSNWIDFWTGKMYEGDTNQNLDVTIDHIPVLVKSGSIIPLATIGSSSSDSLSSPMEIRVFPGSDGAFTLYEDNNDDSGYHNEQLSKINFYYTEKDKSLVVESILGVYTGMIVNRVFRVVEVTDSTGIGSEMSTKFQEVKYKGKRIKIKL